MKDTKRQLESIAERANELLRRWGIHEPQIVVDKRMDTQMAWLLPYWGWGSWREPTFVFSFGGAEIGAYSDKARRIKVGLNDTVTVVGRPNGRQSKHTLMEVTYPVPIHFFLALAAFCSYHFAKDMPTYHPANFLRYASRIEVYTHPTKIEIKPIGGCQVIIRVAPNGDTHATLADATNGKVYRTDKLDKTLALLTRACFLSRL